jgi:hypothetical protein
MITHAISVRPLTGEVGAGAGASGSNDGAMPRFMLCIRRAVCGMLGHNQVLQFTHDRLCLQCVDCGKETPGWTIGVPPYTDPRPR